MANGLCIGQDSNRDSYAVLKLEYTHELPEDLFKEQIPSSVYDSFKLVVRPRILF